MPSVKNTRRGKRPSRGAAALPDDPDPVNRARPRVCANPAGPNERERPRYVTGVNFYSNSNHRASGRPDNDDCESLNAFFGKILEDDIKFSQESLIIMLSYLDAVENDASVDFYKLQIERTYFELLDIAERNKKREIIYFKSKKRVEAKWRFRKHWRDDEDHPSNCTCVP